MNARDRIQVLLDGPFAKDQERKRLTAYVFEVSPTRTQVRTLLSVLLENKTGLKEHQVARKVEVKPELLSALYNKLLLKFEEYLMIREFLDASYLEKKIKVYPILSKIGLEKHSQFVSKKIYQYRKNIPYHPDYAFGLFRFHSIEVVNHKVYGYKRQDASLESAATQLERLYFIERAKLFCEGFNRNHFLNEDHPVSEFTLFRETVPTSIKEDRLLKIYLDIAGQYDTKFDTISLAYISIRENWDDLVETEAIQKLDIITLAHYLLNLCLVGVKKEFLVFTKEYISIINKLTSLNLLLENGAFPEKRFKTCISMGLLNSNIKWAEQFYDRFADKVAGSSRKDVLRFCRGLIDFEKITDMERMDFNEFGVKLEDVNHELGLRKLKLKLQIRAKIWEDIPYTIYSTKRFLRVKKSIVSGSHHDSMIEFIGIVELLNPNRKRNKTTVEDIEKAIDESVFLNVSDKEWLSKFIRGRM